MRFYRTWTYQGVYTVRGSEALTLLGITLFSCSMINFVYAIDAIMCDSINLLVFCGLLWGTTGMNIIATLCFRKASGMD